MKADLPAHMYNKWFHYYSRNGKHPLSELLTQGYNSLITSKIFGGNKDRNATAADYNRHT